MASGTLTTILMVALSLPLEWKLLYSDTPPSESIVYVKNKQVEPSWKGEMSVDNAAPAVAWLMSFPNSGTSYTSRLVRQTSGTRTASNYGHETYNGKTYPSKPVFADQPEGPFWTESPDQTEYPSRFVLTKTHCGGRCEDCPPERYVETTYSFRRMCHWGRRVVEGPNHTLTQTDVIYPSQRVRKAVHLIRSPFDNVVSRFHLEMKGSTKYPKTEEGFREYCFSLNNKHDRAEHKVSFLTEEILNATSNVPCRADFFRYIEWHNLAFATTRDMGLETLVIHYDQYALALNETVDQLMNFLNLEAKHEAPSFERGKSYDNYFRSEEVAAVRQAFDHMALGETWEEVGRYFALD